MITNLPVDWFELLLSDVIELEWRYQRDERLKRRRKWRQRASSR